MAVKVKIKEVRQRSEGGNARSYVLVLLSELKKTKPTAWQVCQVTQDVFECYKLCG
jgi:hypothetical protein